MIGTTPEVDIPDALNIHLTGEKVALLNIKFTDNKAAGGNDGAGNAGDNSGNTGSDGGKGTPQTDDIAPVAALAAVAVVACAAVVVSRKKVTE